ncbi:Uncharacterised protein [Mycobacteroides abscessus subsp. abscessus]|nr:Uncharacterised protein [Mycobacteroides abscessus subsp. abscessus]
MVPDGLALGAAFFGVDVLGSADFDADVLGAAVFGAAVFGAAVFGAAVFGMAVVDSAGFTLAAGFGFDADALGVGFGATTARGASDDDSTFLSSDSPEIAPMRFKSSRRSASVSLAAFPSCFSASFRTSSRLCWSSPICFCRRLIAFFSPMPSALRRRRLQDPRTRG